MKRITNKPWFGKKYFGWGLRPVSWEGWLVTVAFLIIIIVDAILFKKSATTIVVFLIGIVVFITVVILTGDKPGSILWDRKEKRPLLILVYLAILAVVSFGLYQIHTLNVAHSSFENYYKFRGCVELLEKTDTYGTCKLASGQTIKLVQINGRWFLDGDGPGVF